MTIRAGLVGIGSYLPEKILTNAELSKMVNTSDEWIRSRTGIVERRIAPAGTLTSELGTKAAQQALAAARLAPADIQAIITATTSPDMICPSTACAIQRNLGATSAAAFDLLAACSGFVYALNVARGLVTGRVYQRVLVVASEVLSAMVDWQDRSTCVLFGDGAGAAVIAPVSRGGILSVVLGADGSCADLLEIPAGGSRMPASHETVDQHLHTLRMKGNEVFKWAVRRMLEAADAALREAGVGIEEIACVIPHQANLRNIDAVAERLHIAREKVFVNVDHCGNMSAASTIVALHEAVGQGRVKLGDKVLLVTFGSGFTWGATVIEW